MASGLSQEKLKEHLERIDQQVDVINGVVTALSDVARLPEPQAKSCQIADLLHAMLKTVKRLPFIQWNNDLSADLQKVSVDERQIPIAISNLISNAQDAMSESGQLTISATTLDNSTTRPTATPSLRLDITDTGSGIEPEILNQVMEPFFSTKARGMGLAITRAIVEKTRGDCMCKVA